MSDRVHARGRRRQPLGLAALVVVSGFLGLAGCGGGGSDASTTTTTAPGVLGTDDLDRLSLFLLRDHQAGGAEVEVHFASAGQDVTMTGAVDWADHEGALEVAVTGGGDGAGRYEVRFTENHVYESLPAAEVQRLAASGRPGIGWSVRAPAPADDPLDRVLALLVSLAGEKPDNPALLAGKGFTVEDRKPVDGVAATTYRSSTDALYSVDDDRGVLVRFQGVVAGIDQPVTMTFRDHGPRSVTIPAEATTVAAGDLAAG